MSSAATYVRRIADALGVDWFAVMGGGTHHGRCPNRRPCCVVPVEPTALAEVVGIHCLIDLSRFAPRGSASLSERE
jgi:hypothetical protein